MKKILLLKFSLPCFLILLTLGGFFLWKDSHRGRVTVFSTPGDKTLQDFYNQSQQIRGPQESSTTVTFLAAGDIMLSRDVAVQIEQHQDASYPFLGMADVLKSVDFNFANLESPFAPAKPVVGGHSLIFGAAEAYAQTLANYNFKILNLANNHAFDQGLAGLDYTRSLLDKNNIAHEGTGDNLDEAWTPAVVYANGIKICFVGASYASINDGGKATSTYVARMEDIENLKLNVENSKKICDFVVATLHGGVEYTRTPNSLQTTFAHAAIDDGADMVIGAHPHWIQTIEKYKEKYIFYSLGNFIFDQNFSQDTKEGLTLKIQASKSECHPKLVSGSTSSQSADSRSEPGMTCGDSLQGQRISAALDSIEILPVIITDSQPHPATAEETKNILQKIGLTETILK